MKIRTLLLTLVVVFSFGLAGCDFGDVDQGRTIAYDANTKTVTFVQDAKHDQQNPEYNGQVVSFKLPSDPNEVGPLPVPGGRLKLDVEKKSVTIFNPETKTIEVVPVNILDVQQLGPNARNHPLVKGKTFPMIDKAKGSITEFSPRQRLLVTFTVPENMLNLPPSTWEAGDEVRVYFKQKGQALRFMNITRTNIYKK